MKVYLCTQTWTLQSGNQSVLCISVQYLFWSITLFNNKYLLLHCIYSSYDTRNSISNSLSQPCRRRDIFVTFETMYGDFERSFSGNIFYWFSGSYLRVVNVPRVLRVRMAFSRQGAAAATVCFQGNVSAIYRSYGPSGSDSNHSSSTDVTPR